MTTTNHPDPTTPPAEPAPSLRPVEELLQLLACGRVADPGCCSTCGGSGYSGEEATGGMCSDCYATGHTHGPVEDLVALGDFLDAVRRAVDALALPSLLARLRAAEETLAAVGELTADFRVPRRGGSFTQGWNAALTELRAALAEGASR